MESGVLRVLEYEVILARLGSLAWLAAALAGQAQTGDTLYTLTGEWSSPAQSYPLFDRAFTANGEFGGVATDGVGNVYVVSGPSISKINAQGIMIPVTGFGPAAVAPGEQIWALLASTESYSLAGDSQGDLFIATDNATWSCPPASCPCRLPTIRRSYCMWATANRRPLTSGSSPERALKERV